MQPAQKAVQRLASGRFPPTIQDVVANKDHLEITSPSELWSMFDIVRKTYYDKKSTR